MLLPSGPYGSPVVLPYSFWTFFLGIDEDALIRILGFCRRIVAAVCVAVVDLL